MIFDPTSSVLVSVNEPVDPPALSPSHVRVDPPWDPSMSALPPASARLPLTVAFDFVPLPVALRPLLPGPAARAAEGVMSAAVARPAATSQDNRRANMDRLRVICRCFMRYAPILVCEGLFDNDMAAPLRQAAGRTIAISDSGPSTARCLVRMPTYFGTDSLQTAPNRTTSRREPLTNVNDGPEGPMTIVLRGSCARRRGCPGTIDPNH